MWQVAETLFDLVGKLEPILVVKPLEIVLAHRLRGRVPLGPITAMFAPLYRLLKSFVKIHNSNLSQLPLPSEESWGEGSF
jgi:hypothetical protein